MSAEIVWQPQPGPQHALMTCPVPEVFYGGASGGGKTDGVLGKWARKADLYGADFNAIFFRRELPMADDAIERGHEIFGALGWSYNGGKYTFRSPLGARIRFRPLERLSDAEKYMGQNVTDACVEEAGNFPDPRPVLRLNGLLRSAHGVPTQLLLTGNPGGPGQHWLKSRYIDPAPQGFEIIREKLPNGREHQRVFIPAKLRDNKLLMLGDPDYENRLHLVGSEELVRAWLDGDWNAIEGAFFDCWSDRLVIRPVELPDHWFRFRSMDWGSAAPFSIGWWAVSDGEDLNAGADVSDAYVIPQGAMVRYREWYGAERDGTGAVIPNVGLKMTAEDVAAGIVERTSARENISYNIADPSIFAVDGGPSIAERMLRKGLAWRKADNRRVPRAGAMGGWDVMRSRMIGEDDKPMIYCFHSCTESIRTIPMLQHHPDRPEDINEAEDHAADEWRYACMSRPWIRRAPKAKRPIDDTITWNDLRVIKDTKRRRI